MELVFAGHKWEGKGTVLTWGNKKDGGKYFKWSGLGVYLGQGWVGFGSGFGL